MDRERFDLLARLLATKGSRRGALGAILGVALFGHDAEEGVAKPGKGKGKARGKNKNKNKERSGGRERLQADAGRCCGAKSCTKPTAGSNRYECNFAGQDLSGGTYTGVNFGRIDGRGTNFNNANVRGANFGGACLQNATFRGADVSSSNFGRACLFGADFTGAKNLNVSVKFSTALLCNTKLADGSISNRDCNTPTRCCGGCSADGDCGTGQVCCDGRCKTGNCCTAGDCEDRQCKSKTCSNNRCEYAPVTGRGPLCDTTCCNGVCCPAGKECVRGECVGCQPNCDGKECGSDGCGGQCPPGCPQNQTCNAQGKCICTAQSCPNGCCTNGPGNPGICKDGDTDQNCGTGGETCETCPSGKTCQNGDCVPVTCRGGCSKDSDCPDVANCVCNLTTYACCTPESRERTCAGKCGYVTNNCGQRIDCGDCEVRTCQDGACTQQNTCNYVDSEDNKPGPNCPAPKFCCDGDCCARGDVCLADGCCTPISTCPSHACGRVPDGCGGTIDCGDCPVRTCKTATCTDYRCLYRGINGTTGPNCTTVCCTNTSTGESVCCPAGVTTCDAHGNCACPTGKKPCGNHCIDHERCCTGGVPDRCPDGKKCCRGECINEDRCCPACPDGETCLGGACCPNARVCGTKCLSAPCSTQDCLRCDAEDGICVSDCDPRLCEVCDGRGNCKVCPDGGTCVGGRCVGVCGGDTCDDDEICCRETCLECPQAPSTRTRVEGNPRLCPGGVRITPTPGRCGVITRNCPGGGTCQIRYCFSADGKRLSFEPVDGERPCAVDQVVVKGGPNAFRYTFNPDAVCAEGLVSPLNRGGNVPQISHVDFCGIGCC